MVLILSLAQPQPLCCAEQLEPLLAGLAAGDRDSLAELYHRTRAAVYGLALSYLKNSQDAEDVTQDTFVRAWEKAAQYQRQGKPLQWLLAIARNLSLMKLRQKTRTADLPEEDWLAIAADAPALTPEEKHLLHTALTQLSEEESRIVLLHAVTGLKHREIAAMLDLALPTVLSKYNRAIKKLGKSLEEAE